MRFPLAPFGFEYCYFSKWSFLEKVFIRCFGVVDLPTRIRFLALQKVLRGKKFQRILDAGCGCGFYAFHFARAHPHALVDGVDRKAEFIAEAEKVRQRLGYKNLTFHNGVLESLNCDGEYDLIVCFETLPYVADGELVMRNLRKAIAPEGMLVLSLPCVNPEAEEQSLRSLLSRHGFCLERLTFTFGNYHNFLVQVFSFSVHRARGIVPLLYPLLLLLTRLHPLFYRRGTHLLAVARPMVRQAHQEGR